MFLDDIVRNVQPHSGADARWLGREEQIENARLNFRRNAGSIVRDFHHDTFVLPARFDFQFPFALHRVNRIIDDVRPHLIQLAPVRFDARQSRVVRADHGNAGFEFASQNDECVFQPFVHIDVLNRCLVKKRVRFHRFDDFRNPFRALVHFVEQRINRTADAQPTQDDGELRRRKFLAQFSDIARVPAKANQHRRNFPRLIDGMIFEPGLQFAFAIAPRQRIDLHRRERTFDHLFAQ